MKMRSYIPNGPHHRPYISEEEVFDRVLTAIRTLRAMPDGERRFLMAGQGSWLGKMGGVLTWHDANAHEDKRLEPLRRVHAEFPSDISEFFGLPGDMVDRAQDTPPAPMRVGDVSAARVRFRSDRMAASSKMRGVNPVKFAPAACAVPEKEHEPPPVRNMPSRAEISDALIAGEWFARLAILLDERFDARTERFVPNIDQFDDRVAEFRSGKRKSPQVDDQRILGWLASGWSLKHIGQRIGVNERETESRIHEIARSLWRIANGTARFADIADRERTRKRQQAREAVD